MSVTKKAVKLTAKESYIKVRLSQGVTKQEAETEAEATGEAITEALAVSQENLVTKNDLGELATKEFVEKSVENLATKEFVEKSVENLATKESVELLAKQQVSLATKESVELLAKQQESLATKESVELLGGTVKELSKLHTRTWEIVTEFAANQKNFATKSDVVEIINDQDVATKSYVDNAIANLTKNMYRLVYSAVGVILTAMAISVTILKIDDNTGLSMEQLHQAMLIMQSLQVQVQGNQAQLVQELDPKDGQEDGQELGNL